MDRSSTTDRYGSQTMASTTGTTGAEQRTESEGKVGTHTHPGTVHSHDHYHVSHHHREAGPFGGDWEHRTYWHTHEHNHAELTHAHDYKLEDEQNNHAKEAHVHDHEAPTQSHQ